jgi:hypothetical protein
MEPQLRNFCMFIKNWTFCTSACSPSVQLLVATESVLLQLVLRAAVTMRDYRWPQVSRRPA